MKRNLPIGLTVFVFFIIGVLEVVAQPTIGTSTFDGAFLQIAGFGPSPRTGSLDGWTFTSVGGGNGFTSRNGSGQISMSMQTPTYYSIGSDDGSEFQLDNINLEFYLGSTTYTITGYRDGLSVTGAVFSESVTNAEAKFIDVSSDTDFDNIDEFRFTFTTSPSSSSITIEDITISAAAGNTPPTAASFTAANGPYEDLTYIFSTVDFGYSDGDVDPLDHVLIEAIPSAGILFVDADNDDVYDGGEELSVLDQVSKADLDAGNLQYIQNGSVNTSFQYEVNDGTENSAGNYIASLNVLPVPTVTLGVTPTSRVESISTTATVTATLSNAYGANTSVSLAFSGTATNFSDYTRSGTSITIPAGATTGSITLSNQSDALYEGNETVVIDISGVSNGTESGVQQVTYTITDDDPQPTATLLLRDIYNPITDESGGQAYIVGELSAVAGVTVTVPLSFSGTATGGGTDYGITGSSIVISPGEPMDSIRVTSIFDGIEEGNETVIIDMETPTNATEDGVQQVTLTINDEDAAPPSGYSVAIDQSPIDTGNESSASFTFAGAEVGSDYDYTFSSSGGGTNVTGSGTIGTATDQITGIDLSGLGDGTITLIATLTDGFGNTGTAATDTETKDTEAPTGYAVTIDQAGISSGNVGSVSFSFAGAEVGADYNYTFSSSGGGTNVTGSGTIATSTDQITGIDLSGLNDGTITLSVTLTDIAGNTGSPATDTETKDSNAPSGYSVTIDQSPINAINEVAVSFTFAGAEVGTDYNYTFSSSGGGTNTTGSGTVVTSTDQITGIDLSGLGDGTITLSVTLTDAGGNIGIAATDTKIKETVPPSGYSVTIDQSPINQLNEGATSFTFSSAEVGATYDYTFSSSGGGTNVTGSGTIATVADKITGIDLSGLGDGTITLSVTLTDTNGNVGVSATDTEIKDTTAPSGYSVVFDQAAANATNSSAMSFTFAAAEIGASYNYTINSSGGGTNVTGSGTITTANDQVTGIDVSGLGDGSVSLAVTLTDAAANIGTTATDNIQKDVVAPTGYSVVIDLLGETVINVINQSIIEFSGSGLEVGTTLNYSFTSDGGGTPVSGTETVTTASQQFDNSGAGYDLSGLSDGTVTLAVTLTDPAGNTGTDATDSETKDAGPPSGYNVAWNDAVINASEASTATFTVSNAEVGTTINYSVSSSGDGNTATVSNPIVVTSNTQVVTIDVSSLVDGTLTVEVSLTDAGGNTGGTVSDNSAVLDQTLPSGYTVTIDQANINSANLGAGSFTFANAEVGATYDYTFSSDGGGANVTGTGTVVTTSDQIAGIDLRGLADGTIILSATLTDAAGNVGTAVTDNVNKDATAPTFISVDDNGGDNSYRAGESLTIVADLGESGLNVTADLSAINSGFSSTAAMADNGDGTYSITIADVDDSGNMVEGTSTAVTLTATDALGNQQTDNSLTLNLDKTAPSGYTVTIDQADINSSNQTGLSFTFAGVEVGSVYNYAITSSGGGTTVTGTGTTNSASEQITGIDVSGLPDGTLTLTVTLTDEAGNESAPSSDTVIKTAAAVQFSTTTSSGDESVSNASLQVELTVLSGQDVTVDYAVSGTATAGGTDHAMSNGTLTIPAGSTNGVIEITGIVDDAITEENETIIVTLSNPTNATIGSNTAHTYTIVDNDEAVLSIEPTTQAAEDATDGLFTVLTSNQFSADVTVNIAISGTATADTDYNAVATSFTFPALTNSVSIPIVVISDTEIEGDETVTITLTGTDNTNVTIGSTDNATVTITDNDEKLPQSISFDAIPDQTLGSGPVILTATSDSGLPITFSISTQPASGVASLSNSTVILEGVGTVTITASQAGNDVYEPAADVTQTFSIRAGEFFLPTLFTPNGDGTNDRFILRGNANVVEIEMSIFDREGNIVFNSTDLNELTQDGWDGTNDGSKQPQGAYVWVIKGVLADGSPILINGNNSGIIKLAR